MISSLQIFASHFSFRDIASHCWFSAFRFSLASDFHYFSCARPIFRHHASIRHRLSPRDIYAAYADAAFATPIFIDATRRRRHCRHARCRFDAAFRALSLMPLSFIFAAEDDFHCRHCLQDFQPILRDAAALATPPPAPRQLSLRFIFARVFSSPSFAGRHADAAAEATPP
jgi:hypothetical protein